MNILIATSKNPFAEKQVGGAETSCRLIAEKLASRGHVIVYLTDNADHNSRQEASRRGIYLRAVPRLQVKGNLVSRWVSRRRWIMALLYLCFRYRIDIIYCFYELAVVDPAIKTRSWLGFPKVVMRMAGLHWYVAIQKDPERISRYESVFNNIDSVNFISPELVQMTTRSMRSLEFKSAFRHSRVLDIGTEMVRCSKESDRFAPNEGVFKVVMATRFSDYQKRQDILIRAIAQLPPEHKIHLTFIGEGKALESMKNLVEEMGVEPYVTFCPFMPQPQLMEILDEQHLLCHACDFEGLGKIIVESMSRGLPVLVSDVEPLNGYINDGETGFLVENTPEAWASYLTFLSSDREQLNRVSQQAMDFARANWCADTNVLEFEQYFRDVMELHG